MEEDMGAFKILTSKPADKRPLGRPRRIWEDNIFIYIKEVGCNKIICIDSTEVNDYWRALVNSAFTIRVP